MRMRIRRNRRTHTRELVVVLQRRETLNATRSRMAEEGLGRPFLPLRCEREGSRSRTTIHYDLEDCATLRDFARAQHVDGNALAGMLQDLVAAMTRCMQLGSPYYALLFDERHVFVARDARLRFVYLPLDGLAFGAGTTPLSLMETLGKTFKQRMESPDDVVLCERMLEFARAQNGVFSLNALAAFVRSEAKERTVSSTGQQIASPTSAGSRVLQSMRHAQEFWIPEDVVIQMGRDERCTARVKHMPKVSRFHASVRASEKGIVLQDLGSTNGTSVEGKRIAAFTDVEVGLHETFFLADEPFVVRRG